MAGLHIGVVIAAGYPLSHDAFSIFATAYALSVTAFSRASSPYGRAKGRASPTRRIEISAQEIRWHRLRRGGYQPPGYFPKGEITSAQSADNAMPNICK